MKKALRSQIADVNKELWLALSMIGIVGVMNYLAVGHRLLLGLYFLPTLFSAYFFGRRHATLTAVASILIVGIFEYYRPVLFGQASLPEAYGGRWIELASWGCILVIIAYAMGTLYERNVKRILELKQTYRGLLLILRHFISKDKYTENHCYRVSIYAAKIASYIGLDAERIDDVRSAALLHDIGKLEISRELLYKAAKLSQDEYAEMRKHTKMGTDILLPVEGPMGRIIPIVLAHHDNFEETDGEAKKNKEIPMEARIIRVSDVYDALVSDRPYRKAMSPFDAKEIIVKGRGTEFDPKVVDAFLKAFQTGELEVPSVLV